MHAPLRTRSVARGLQTQANVRGEQDPRIYGFVRESHSGQKFGCEPTLVINAVKINRLRASGGRLRSRSPLELLCSSVLQAASVRAPWKRARGGASLNRSIGLSLLKTGLRAY